MQLVLVFQVWHRVKRATIVSPDALFAAFYTGPDYRVTPALAAVAVKVHGSFLRHLLDSPEPSTAAARAFFVAQGILGCATFALVIAICGELATRRGDRRSAARS